MSAATSDGASIVGFGLQTSSEHSSDSSLGRLLPRITDSPEIDPAARPTALPFNFDPVFQAILNKKLPHSFSQFTKQHSAAAVKTLSTIESIQDSSTLAAALSNSLTSGSLAQRLVPPASRSSTTRTQMHTRFDIRKTIKISRDILDLRQYAQEKLIGTAFHSTHLHPSAVQSLQETCVEYFHLLYGKELVNLCSERIHNYLESCVVFSAHPLLGYLTKFFFMDLPLSIEAEINLWTYVEARKYLILHNCVNMLSTSSPTGQTMDYLTTRRVDALLCAEEMLRKRGKFGPRAIEDIFSSIEKFPVILSSVEGDSSLDVLEVEGFLELLCSDIIRVGQYAMELVEDVFNIETIIRAKAIAIPEDVLEKQELLESWSKLFLRCLDDVREFLLQCVVYDDWRKGTINFQIFCNLIAHVEFINVLGMSSETKQNIEFVASCFLDISSGEVCYIDFISVLIEGIIQRETSVVFSLSFILDTVSTVRRGLEVNHALKLVTFVGYIQSFHSAGVFWPCGGLMLPKKEEPELSFASPSLAQVSPQSSTSSSFLLASSNIFGSMWYPGGNAASDEPGNLKVESALAKINLTWSAVAENGGDQVQGGISLNPYTHPSCKYLPTSEYSNSAAAVVPEPFASTRDVMNVFGESVKLGKTSDPHSKPGLTAFELTDFITLKDRNVYLHNDPSTVLISTSDQSESISASRCVDSTREDEVSSQQGRSVNASVTVSSTTSRQIADAEYAKYIYAIEVSSEVDVYRRVSDIKDFEVQGNEMYEQERIRFEQRRTTKRLAEEERIRTATARSKLELRKAKLVKKLQAEKIEQAQVKTAALELLERRQIALKEEEKNGKILKEKLAREQAKQAELEFQKRLEFVRLEEEMEKQKLLELSAIEEKKEALLKKAQDEHIKHNEEKRKRDLLLSRERETKIAKSIMDREEKELHCMRFEDINADSVRRTTAAISYGVSESQVVQAKPEHSLALAYRSFKFEGDDFVENLLDNLIALQNRLAQFARGNSTHDRRHGDRAFFMPLVFNEDIRFDIFNSLSTLHWKRDIMNDQVDADGGAFKAEFDDIDATVALKRAHFEEERQKQRWKLHTQDDILNWTSLEVKQAMNWGKFFESEKPIELSIAARELTEEERFKNLIESEQTKTRLGTAPIDDEISFQSNVPDSLLDNLLMENLSFAPLQFGKVVTRLILPQEAAYFQIVVPGAYSLLTIEVSCELGGFDVILNPRTPPTLHKYEYRGHCPSLSSHDSRNLRITLPLESNRLADYSESSLRYFVVLVGDSCGAKVSLWAAASLPTELSRTHSALEVTVNALQRLGNFGVKNLVNNFSKLEAESLKASEVDIGSNAFIENDMEAFLKHDASAVSFDGASSDDSDDEAIAEFLSKSGRGLLTKQTSARMPIIDPNFNADLYERPVVESKENAYALFSPVSWTESTFERAQEDVVVNSAMHDLLQQTQVVKTLISTERKKFARSLYLPSISPKKPDIPSSSSSRRLRNVFLKPIKYTLNGNRTVK